MSSLEDIIEAHAEGTIERERPTLMTVGTMLIGLVPLLWAQGSGADVMKRIAAPMVGGLVTSAFLTLEIIPVVYTYWRNEQLLWRKLELRSTRLLEAMKLDVLVLQGHLVVGIESRGFILGAAVAERLGAGFIPIRKPGKLPGKSIKETYDLEYGKDALEIHADAVESGQRVLIVDDVLATGGTAAAAATLVKKVGGQLAGLAFLIELLFLNGKAKLTGEQVFSVLQY